MTTTLTATPVPAFAAVRLVVTGAPNGPLEILRDDVNGVRPVRQLPGQVVSSGQLTVTDYEAALTGAVTYSCQGVRTNLFTNPSAEVDTTGWGSSRVAITRLVDATAPAGAAVFRGTVNATGAGALTQYVYTNPSLPVKAGTTYSFALSVRLSIATTIRFQIIWMRPDSSTVSATYPATSTAVPANTWTALTHTALAPPEATQARVYLFGAVDWPTGVTIDWDRAWAVDEATPGAYLDTVAPITASATVNLPLTLLPRLAVVARPAQARSVEGVETYSETSESGTATLTIYAGGALSVIAPLERRQGSVGLHVQDYATAKELRELLASGSIVQLRQPTYPGLDLYLSPRRVRIDPAPQDNAPAEWVVTLDYTEELAPDDDLASGAAWTVADLAALLPTVAAVKTSFATVFALAVGP